MCVLYKCIDHSFEIGLLYVQQYIKIYAPKPDNNPQMKSGVMPRF